MNRKYLFIIGGVIAIVFIVAVVLLVRGSGKKTANGPAVTPIYAGAHTSTISSDPNKLLIKGFSGQNYTVNNFIKDPSLATSRLYEDDAYSLIYVKDGDSFHILLKEKPYDQVRQDAQNKLAAILGLASPSTLCDIDVYVNLIGDYGLPPGQEIDYGISGCPGARILPK